MTSKMPLLQITASRRIAKDVYETVLTGDTGAITRPGQFVQIRIPGFYLRRPISVCDVAGDKLIIIYKILGKGTAALAKLPVGESVELLSGLGNGFMVDDVYEKPLIVGGGVGTPPLFGLAKKIIEKGFTPDVVLGFASKDDVFYEEEFRTLGLDVYVTTNDGSYGTQGFVTDKMKDLDYDYVFTCGPMPMLKAVHGVSTDGQFSFEERMGCGFGACMCCTCESKYGPKRICKDGPILFREEIVW
ncbi:MAG: dihydroorotate dehydrogenase electron transfer subunit [Oscillospiraceae bacterium]|jgi:dihydroorotate dehydrogenase electron transfer subunit|nr:dihydroorotate dehydrogenase electron transfer subunit [Oscillospiraceae bacterium]